MRRTVPAMEPEQEPPVAYTSSPIAATAGIGAPYILAVSALPRGADL